MAQTNVQAFSGDVEIANTLTVSDDIIVDNGSDHELRIDASSSMIYNKTFYFPSIAADSYNYLGRFHIHAPPAIFNISDTGSALGSGSRYSMSKGWGETQRPIVNALEGSEFSTYRFYWEPEAGGEENEFYHVWFSPSRAGDYTFYVHAKDYTFPTEPSSPTYNDVVYGLLNLLGSSGTQSHVVVGRPNNSGNATLQLHNESQVTGDRLTHEAIQLFSNISPATGDISNVFITMTPSTVNGGYGGYIEGWIKSGTNSGLSLGNISSGTKYRGLTITSQGSVGVGTNNPEKLLEISGASGLDNSTPVHFRITNTQGATSGNPFTDLTKPSGLISFYTPDTSSAGPGDVAGIGFRPESTLGGDTSLCFYTNSENDDAGTPLQERMCIDHEGNVGIGTTIPARLLHVDGDARIDRLDVASIRDNVGSTLYRHKYISIGLSDFGDNFTFLGTIEAGTNSGPLLIDGALNVVARQRSYTFTLQVYVVSGALNMNMYGYPDYFNSDKIRINYIKDPNDSPHQATNEGTYYLWMRYPRFNTNTMPGNGRLRLRIRGSHYRPPDVASAPSTRDSGTIYADSSNGASYVKQASLGGTWYDLSASTRRVTHYDGNFNINGTKSFNITHPVPEKEGTLYHSVIEGPKGDLIYRGKAQLSEGRVTVDINKHSRMSDGTFEHLTRDVQCMVTNDSDWDHVKGSVEGSILTVTCENENSNAMINWMVMAERDDEVYKKSEIVDKNGLYQPEISSMDFNELIDMVDNTTE